MVLREGYVLARREGKGSEGEVPENENKSRETQSQSKNVIPGGLRNSTTVRPSTQ